MNINKNETSVQRNFAPGGTINPGKILGYILHPEDSDFLSNAETDDLRTNGQAALVRDDDAARCFFIHELGQPTDNGEAVGYETRNQLKIKTDKGTKDMIYMLTSGTWADFIELMGMDGLTGYRAIPVDENGVIWHQRSATGIIGMRTHAVEVQKWEEAITGQAARFFFRLALKDVNEWNSLQFSKQAGFNPFVSTPGLGWAGVKTAYLEEVVADTPVDGQFEFTCALHRGEINLVEKFYASNKWGAPAAWDCTLADGTVIDITAVSIVSVQGKRVRFRVTLDTADTDYNVGDTAYISLKAISVLAASPILTKYYQSNRLEITLT